ncbi:hypothetical protein GCM10010376_09610 [Streptomyces violaceusniger]
MGTGHGPVGVSGGAAVAIDAHDDARRWTKPLRISPAPGHLACHIQEEVSQRPPLQICTRILSNLCWPLNPLFHTW